MQIIKQYPSGSFCWVDLITANLEEVKSFYCGLLGWECEDLPMGEGMSYTICRYQGQQVSAMYAMDKGMINNHIPSSWISHISVDDIDAVVAKANSLGATAPLVCNMLDFGRVAKVKDPMGAWFNLWQPSQHIGAALVNQPGSWCWNELAVRSTEIAMEFYGKLFGWREEVSAGPGGNPYVTVYNNDRLAGGMIAIDPERGDVPPHWGVYFAVEDCEQATRQAEGLGATIISANTRISEVGTFSVLLDPGGAKFSVIALKAADPPPGY